MGEGLRGLEVERLRGLGVIKKEQENS